MKYQTYPNYKPSGVEWLGEVPEHWEIKRLKFLCEVQTGDKDTVNAIEDGKYPFFVRSQTVERINSFTFDCEAVLTAGDGVGVGKVFHYVNGKFDFHQRVYMMNNFNNITGIFFFHYLATLFHKVALDGGAKSTVDSLRMPLFMNFQLSVPPFPEQQKIAQFLDHETAKIDTLIDKQQRLIALLKEKRQAVISHAVTKGLNPNAPMKPSGVEWLGDVPVGWEVKQAKHVFVLQRGHDLSSDKFIEGKYPVYGSNGSIGYHNEYTTYAPSLTVGRSGSVGEINYIDENFWAHNTSLYLKETKNAEVKFIYYMLLAMNVKSLSAGSAVGTLDRNNIHSMYVIHPAISEQAQISVYLDKKLQLFEDIKYKANAAIELMQERRTALISAAVTGKIDVRDWGD